MSLDDARFAIRNGLAELARIDDAMRDASLNLLWGVQVGTERKSIPISGADEDERRVSWERLTTATPPHDRKAFTVVAANSELIPIDFDQWYESDDPDGWSPPDHEVRVCFAIFHRAGKRPPIEAFIQAISSMGPAVNALVAESGHMIPGPLSGESLFLSHLARLAISRPLLFGCEVRSLAHENGRTDDEMARNKPLWKWRKVGTGEGATTVNEGLDWPAFGKCLRGDPAILPGDYIVGFNRDVAFLSSAMLRWLAEPKEVGTQSPGDGWKVYKSRTYFVSEVLFYHRTMASKGLLERLQKEGKIDFIDAPEYGKAAIRAVIQDRSAINSTKKTRR